MTEKINPDKKSEEIASSALKVNLERTAATIEIPQFFVEVFISISRKRGGASEGHFASPRGRAKRVQGGFFHPPQKIWVFLGFLGQFLGCRQSRPPISPEFSWVGLENHPLPPRGGPNDPQC